MIFIFHCPRHEVVEKLDNMMKGIHVLLIEDNEGDVLLIKEAFEETESLAQMSIVRDGEEARDFLRKTGEYALTPEMTSPPLCRER